MIYSFDLVCSILLLQYIACEICTAIMSSLFIAVQTGFIWIVQHAMISSNLEHWPPQILLLISRSMSHVNQYHQHNGMLAFNGMYGTSYRNCRQLILPMNINNVKYFNYMMLLNNIVIRYRSTSLSLFKYYLIQIDILFFDNFK